MNALRRTASALLVAALVLIGAPGTSGVGVPQAHAQEQRQGGGLLRFLFEPRRPPPTVQEAPRAQPRQRQGGSRQAPRRQQQARQPAPTAGVEKAQDARQVLVVGDFLASGLAEGLETAFAEDASVRVTSRANGSSGLVRADYYDWPASLGPMLGEVEPAAVVVMLGSNDRQAISANGQSHPPLSEAWLAEYEARATRIAQAASERDVPLIWVGMIPFRASAMSADMLALNDVYRKVAEDAGGRFVDVWDGFVDENGAFVQNGPDMNGQPTQLREGDGINVTRAGRRKLAFYVERPLLQTLGEAPQAELVFFGPEIPEGFTIGRWTAPDIERTQPVALFSSGAPSSELLGGRFVRPSNGTQRRNGDDMEPDLPPVGRADDFMLTRPQPALETGAP